jgi:hypothetical protein
MITQKRKINKYATQYRIEEFRTGLEGMVMKDIRSGKNNVYEDAEHQAFVDGFNSAVEYIKEEFNKFFPNI